MALQEKRGWLWDHSEKQAVAADLRKLKRNKQVLTEQLRRFRLQLPQLAADADTAARPFLEQCEVLEKIDCRTNGRKYQPISPAEAADRLRQAVMLASQWAAFCKRPDVTDAIRANNRAAAEAKRASQRQIAGQLADPDLPRQLLELWEELKLMGLIVFNARGAKWPHSHDELVRLLDHRLIALTASSSRAVKERLRDILARQDPSCVREALEVVAQVLVEKEADAFRRSPAPPLAVGDQSYALLESTVVGFPNDFLREGLSPQAFLEKDLRLIGVDCSPKDPPPSAEVSRPETAPPKRQPAQEARPGGGTSEVLPGGRG